MPYPPAPPQWPAVVSILLVPLAAAQPHVQPPTWVACPPRTAWGPTSLGSSTTASPALTRAPTDLLARTRLSAAASLPRTWTWEVVGSAEMLTLASGASAARSARTLATVAARVALDAFTG